VNNIDFNKRIILALDVDDVEFAKNWVQLTKSRIKFYKVGLQLFLKGGLNFVKWLKDQDVDVMLDLKLFDIPRTVNAALEQVKDYADYITVHSRMKIMKEIPENVRHKILGVTVLTCFDNDDLTYDGCSFSPKTLVLKRAKYAIYNKCAGVVASGLEITDLRERFGNEFKMIVPSIKLEKPRDDDQARVVTYKQAFKDGADHIVVGRPIIQSDDPMDLIERVQENMRYIVKREKRKEEEDDWELSDLGRHYSQEYE